MWVAVATLVAASAPPTWKVIHGKDNFGYDIVGGPAGNVEALKELCASYRFCAGFSSAFGLLKFNVSEATLGDQPNTDLYVRDPAPPPIPQPPPFGVWPMPASWSAGTAAAMLSNASFDFSLPAGAPAVLADAVARARSAMFPAPPGAAGAGTAAGPLLTGCDVAVADAAAPLSLGVNESYTLRVPAQGRAELSAQTVWGAMRGLETFVQMVEYDSWDALRGGVGSIPGVPIDISDAPRFKYRGLLIDTSRHFLPVDLLLNTVDALAQAKMNVFHWHVVDSQAFPFNSTSFPKLSLFGAYDPQRQTYSHEDARRVAEYANARGIIVIPEFDVPAHTASWLWSYPELGGSVGTSLDPTLDVTYQFLEKLLDEITGVFPDAVVHLGGDELTLSSWNTSAVRKWMAANNVSSLPELEGHFFARLRAMLRKNGKKMQLWHEPLQNGAGIDDDVLIEQWGGDITAAWNVTATGHQVVYAAPYYIQGKDWSQLYSKRFLASTDQGVERMVAGGEACMWGEFVDSDNQFQAAWPAAAAVAERLWGAADAGNNPYIDILSADRLAKWRCRARLRGLPVAPVGLPGGPYACLPDARQWRRANPRHK